MKLRTFKKEVLFGLATVAVFGLLLYLETNLPFFTRFLPVGENKLIIVLLNINLLLILLLAFIIARILIKTNIEKKRGVYGSKLKTKLTLTMLSISLISSFTLFIIATTFFYVAMDKWFSQKIEDTIDTTVELSQLYYDDLFERYEKIGKHLAGQIEKKGILEKPDGLRTFIKREGQVHFLDYLAVYDMAGVVLQSQGKMDAAVVQRLLAKSKVPAKEKRLRQILPMEGGEVIVLGIGMADPSGTPAAVLVLGERIGFRGTESVKQITRTGEEFKESRPYKKVLKWSFIIPLFLITMLSIFFSVWVGVKMATEITVPLEQVREGAAIIAKGSFDINLEDRGKDEIGTLVSAFNKMARELKVTKAEIEEKRKYMEVILDNVATGIITTDEKGNILLLNRAAKAILGVERDDWMGSPLRTILGGELRKIIRFFQREMKGESTGSVVREMHLSLKRDMVYLRASLTVLRDEAGRVEGYIGTFDDITHIVRGEKLATWREIAKKLTHEIKNPLTPIKLSAERIRRRLLPQAEGKERELLDETTAVILSASDDIKVIVNELTKLTHTATVQTIEDINLIVDETIGLYKNLYQNIDFQFEKENVPKFRMDKDKVKRALINLVTNSIKAIDSEQGIVTLTTRYDKNRGLAFIEIADTGPGIRDEDKGRIFDPYFTRGRDGMGLGLAIVNSIILEHNGKIHVEDNKPRGAKFIVELPVIDASL
ncbi:MAG: ATP-binding protein [Syntrophorhabdales bacterium]|jgi:two-component system nitrogen regulation sensor histidine kinase NtrY